MRSGSWNREKRPVLHIPLSPVEIILEIMTITGLVFTILITIKAWPVLPDIIPTHFNAAGKPDGWGGKETLLGLLAINIFLIYIPMTFLSRYPHICNYLWPITEENAQAQYYNARLMMNWIKTETIYLFVFIHWEIIQSALSKANGLGSWFLPVTLVVIFGTIGICLYKSYKVR